MTVAGVNSILPKEDGREFYTLQILNHLEKDVCAIAAWDSSIHDSPHLNKVTEGQQSAVILLLHHLVSIFKLNIIICS